MTSQAASQKALAVPSPAARRASRLTLGEALANQARSRPRLPAVVSERLTLDYAELDRLTNQLAHGLLGMGVGRGDRVGIIASNTVEHVLLQHALAKIGGILVVLNWRQSEEEMSYAIALVEPRLLVLQRQHLDLLPVAPGVPETMVMDDAGQELFSHLTMGQPDHCPDVYVDPEDVVTILYTSGTTGRPKAAAISQRAMIARAFIASSALGVTSEDAHLAWAPMYHIVSADYVFITMLLGGKYIVVPGFDVEAINEYLHSDQLGWFVLMPGTFDPLIERVKRDPRPVKPIRRVGAMADLLPARKLAELTSTLSASFYNSYGTTEVGPITSGLIAPGASPPDLGKRLSALVSTEIRKPDGSPASVGEVGELMLSGPAMFSGYWNDHEATEEAFADGWYHSGDLLRRDDDGLVHFASRSKYLIKSGGENIYPAEIERVLLALPQVSEAAVVRMPDPHWGETPVAFIGLNDEISSEALQQACRASLAGYKVPRRFVVLPLEDFPRNVTGKVMRDELEKRIPAMAAIGEER